jgi:sugar phosphate isomerase/epimerase
MTIPRRSFLKAAGTAGACLSTAIAIPAWVRPLWALSAESKYVDTIGLQLWTVRNQLDEDKRKTLQAVANAGYKQAELMKVVDADEMIPICKDVGLQVTSAFLDWNSIARPNEKDVPSVEAQIEKAQDLGLKHLVFGYIGKGVRETVDHFKGHAERANRAGERCREAGIQLCYHNHSFEFSKIDGETTGFDIFMAEFERDLVKFEIDVFWVAIGGWNPVETMQRLAGRISQVHLKDLKADVGIINDEGAVPADAFKELGAGTIDMGVILQVAEEVGVQQCHVEQDQSPAPLASIEQSMQLLRKL